MITTSQLPCDETMESKAYTHTACECVCVCVFVCKWVYQCVWLRRCACASVCTQGLCACLRSRRCWRLLENFRILSRSALENPSVNVDRKPLLCPYKDLRNFQPRSNLDSLQFTHLFRFVFHDKLFFLISHFIEVINGHFSNLYNL